MDDDELPDEDFAEKILGEMAQKSPALRAYLDWNFPTMREARMSTEDFERSRKEALRHYLRAVASDLVMRGLVRNHQGWTIIQILKQEPAVVWGSIVRDFADEGFSVVKEVAGGFLSSVFSTLRRR